jgi:formiminoglutamase
MPSTNRPLNPPGSPTFRDRYETKVAQWVKPWSENATPDVVFVGAPLSKTSISHSGASLTPSAFRELFSALSTYNIDHDIDLAERFSAVDAGDAKVHVTDLSRARAGIRDAVATVLHEAPRAMPVIIGGDHSITAPSVDAFRAHADGPIGIVQLDAHMDLRNLDDGGPSNGTPIRQLIEAGTVDGRHIAQVGLHAFANAKPYQEFARANGITQITAREVAHEGIEPIIARALAAASRGTKAVYVTVDMDVLDQAYAPGVPAMVPGGMTTWQLFDALLLLGQAPIVHAIDVVEVDPANDYRRATVRAAVHGVLTFLTGVAMRSTHMPPAA